MLSKFFIERPIFASVVSIVIVVAGAAAVFGLPIAEYPNLAPATIKVTANYPGADSQVVADTVAAPIEQEVNGVEGMLYMKSTCSSDGAYALTVTFAPGTNLDIASVQVQNRVAVAEPKLPEDVRRLGVKTDKQMPDFAQMVSVTAQDGADFDDIFLSNLAYLRLRDQLKRVDGVGDVRVFGAAEYSMRVWLDPRKMEERGISTGDVLGAIREQNVQVAAGKIGEEPAQSDVAFQYNATVRGRLRDAEEFGRIVIRTGDDGSVLRVGDIARIQLGAQNYTIKSRLNGAPAATLAIYQLPGANLIDISDAVGATLDTIRPTLPEGVDVRVTYDAANVVKASIAEIVETLIIAALLVILTVLVFLQDFRATLIPTVTIPVSLIGTFAVMAALGFSLNTLTLFGLVLAIGIVVDDAIVVVENVARNLEETDMSPREAATKAMAEVTGPVIATTLVLLAVFVPTSFMGGLTGVMYQQFGLTIAAATVFSSVNALTLAPALCAVLMRRQSGRRNIVFRGFEAAIGSSTRVYGGLVTGAVRKLGITMLLFVATTALGAWGFARLPGGFVPSEDKGYVMAVVQLPDAASMQRTSAVVDKVDAILADMPGVKNNLAILGYSFIDDAANANAASHIVVLDHWDERQTPQTQQAAIVKQMLGRFYGIPEAQIFAFEVPPIPGVGLVSGFDMQVQDRGGLGIQALQASAQGLAADASTQSALTGLYSSFRASVPQLFVDVDRDKVKQIGIPLTTVFDTLQANLGSAYANDFNAFNRTYPVRIQADAPFRATPEDALKLKIRTPQNTLIPLESVATIEQRFAPPTINRYNLYPAASVKGSPAAGYSSGQALDLMEQAATALPAGMGYEWTGLSYQEKQAGGQIGVIFLLSVLLVFLVLAAQYESWTLPIAIVLAVPLGLFGAAAGAMMRGYDNNTYTQIGIVLLVALVSKNAILIVEFAREKRREGLSPADAAIEAAKLRFRPILMTAFSFVLGTFPLVIATGAGAGARTALGTAVFFGLLFATLFGVVFTPAIYRAVQGASESFGRKRPVAAAPAQASTAPVVPPPAETKIAPPPDDS